MELLKTPCKGDGYIDWKWPRSSGSLNWSEVIRAVLIKPVLWDAFVTIDQLLSRSLIQNWFHWTEWGGDLQVNIVRGVIKESTTRDGEGQRQSGIQCCQEFQWPQRGGNLMGQIYHKELLWISSGFGRFKNW